MLHAYHKCCTNGTCNVFLWQSSRKHQIILIKKVKPVLLKKERKKREIQNKNKIHKSNLEINRLVLYKYVK